MTAARSARRAAARAAVLLVLSFGTLLAAVTPASAHPTLLFTDPAPDTAVPTAPTLLTLAFNEPVTVGQRAVTLLDGAGREVPLGAPTLARGGQNVSARPAGPLAPGAYSVRWRVTGSDGDQVEEEFRFAIGTAVTGSGTSGGSSISWLEAALRWLLFAGVAVALGGLVGERFAASARAENPALRAPRSQLAPGTLVALAGAAGLVAVLLAGAGAEAWRSRIGLLLLVESAGLVLALVLGTVASGRFRRASALPLLAVVVADGLRSHANQAIPGWGAALTAVHLAAVAVWAGTLVYVVRTAFAWRTRRPAVRWVLAGYLRLAGWVFAAVVATGALSAVVLIPLSDLFDTAYGRVLLVKLGLVAVAAGAALAGRSAARGNRLGGVRAVARVEAVVLIGVLAASAVLVSTPPAGSQQSGPPPASGLVVPLGALAGQIGVSAAASDGQLVVRLSTPRRGDYYSPQAAQDFSLSGRLSAGDSDLSFRGCGEGCFVSTVDWRAEDNVLTLNAGAAGWHGGVVSLIVPWPARPGNGDLSRAVEKLRSAEKLTVYESVTSDTSAAAPPPQRLDLTGSFFAAQEPYASGVAPLAARISPDGRPVRLALGYPAASTDVVLALDGQGRISEETLSDDTHLIHRRFVYPG
ncbi:MULTISPECIES: copper resistance CopC/CopD family protein [Amycolatopsis]|uniref:Copper resistance protein CopC/CopD n=1 Tax=Amycolatopsis echigonensis TaxID=2576905 RepID=A0A2N3WL71_9PSEU|nr:MULTISPECIES: copper resistance protein CopC [Amycolatopsis]MBB2499920.1 copper resistance protein CopC/CopD [Amycolatopsis echigonensis]MCG3751162.1 copper resistance protein CopC/CopD [Amycolatopsis sp. Poz14]PKV94624.1 copper transport protein [Amycolatopsis niigatensis]